MDLYPVVSGKQSNLLPSLIGVEGSTSQPQKIDLDISKCVVDLNAGGFNGLNSTAYNVADIEKNRGNILAFTSSDPINGVTGFTRPIFGPFNSASFGGTPNIICRDVNVRIIACEFFIAGDAAARAAMVGQEVLMSLEIGYLLGANIFNAELSDANYVVTASAGVSLLLTGHSSGQWYVPLNCWLLVLCQNSNAAFPANTTLNTRFIGVCLPKDRQLPM
jgi:hypothetical protein